jgi:outer membrane protein assembly factor BamB
MSTSGWSEPALGPDGTIYVASDDAFLRAVTPQGQIKWVTQLGSSKGYTLAVDQAGLIYAAAEDGMLIRVNENGDLPGFIKGIGASFSYPVVMISGQDCQFIVSDANNGVWRFVIPNR